MDVCRHNMLTGWCASCVPRRSASSSSAKPRRFPARNGQGSAGRATRTVRGNDLRITVARYDGSCCLCRRWLMAGKFIWQPPAGGWACYACYLDAA